MKLLDAPRATASLARVLIAAKLAYIPYGSPKLRSDTGSGRSSIFKPDGSMSIEFIDTVAPASDYAKVRDFFDKLWTSQQSAVVLTKQ